MAHWWGKTTVRRKDDKSEVQKTEIDILAVSKQATQYLVGECKFKNKSFRYSEYLDTVAKLSPQGVCILSETRKPQDQPFRDLVVFPLLFDRDLTPVVENERNALISVNDCFFYHHSPYSVVPLS